jgi:hypothetical protein
MKCTRNEDFMNSVVEQLMKNFLPALQCLCSEKSYYSHVGHLAEILDWAKDFGELHYDKFSNAPLGGSNNDFNNNSTLESLIMSFGRERTLIFYKENAAPANCFIEKYLSLQT